MKYKLIKSYPNSRETGTIVSPVPQPDTASKTSRYIDSSGRYYGWHEVEDYPEYWEEVKGFKPQIGDWITRLDQFDNKFLARVMEIKDGREIYTGFDYLGQWFENEDPGEFNDEKDRLATPQEIETHLIAEAKKRGFAKGVSYRYPDRPDLGIRKVESNEFGYNPHLEMLYDVKAKNGIYNEGKWAEIVKEEPIMIAGYKAEYDRDHQVHFGCKTYSQESINQLVSVMNIFDIVRFDTNKAHNVEYAVVRKVQNNFK